MIHGMSVDFSLFLTYSFAGWLWESTVCSLYNYGKLINRGFLNGPYCPIYGCGGLLAIPLPDFWPAVRFAVLWNTRPAGVWKSCFMPAGGIIPINRSI